MTTLYNLATMKDTQKIRKIGKFLVKYQKYREIFLRQDCTLAFNFIKF